MRINENILKVVAFLGICNARREFIPYGTGFIVALEYGGFAFPYLVTAKHVLEDMKSTKCPMVCRVNDRNGQSQIGLIEDEWFYHCRLDKCDVAVTNFSASRDKLDYKRVRLNDSVLTEDYIEKNDIGCGDEVFTVGLLTAHFGITRNLPVTRIGNIAAMPNEEVYLGNRLGSQKVYLIESRSIGGLSGSPVFLHTQLVQFIYDQAIVMEGHHRDYLMGINIGLFETSVHGDTLSRDAANDIEKRREFLETISAGIALVVPIQRVIEIINEDPTLIADRQRVVKNRDKK